MHQSPDTRCCVCHREQLPRDGEAANPSATRKRKPCHSLGALSALDLVVKFPEHACEYLIT
jgi:hypothetical protein